MKALREAALWLAVFGSVAGVGWSLHEWEAAGRGESTAFGGLGHQDTLCVTGADASRVNDLDPQCDATPMSGEPGVLHAGQVGLD